MSSLNILRVAVPVPRFQAFDYLPPNGLTAREIPLGSRLLVPFGRGNRCGLVVGYTSDTQVEPGRLKAALQLLDRDPLLPPAAAKLILWAADYYRYPVGEAAFSALPSRLRKGRAMRLPGTAGWKLSDAGAAIDTAQLTRAPKQARTLRILAEAGGSLTQAQLTADGEASPQGLRALAEKGWIEPLRLDGPPAASPPDRPARLELNPAQRLALQAMTEPLSGFRVFLLHGVTGSGKTEVYLSLAERYLEAGYQILILVPEIALTPQLLRRFRRRIALPIALLHSGLSEGDREQAWLAGRQGTARVLLGTRSAIFAPLPELGLIIVDEEHDLSFKQQDGFRYSARDLAVVRARQRACPLVLGSATPSLESLRNAAIGRYQLVDLPQRAGSARPPRIDLLDIRGTHLRGGLSPFMLQLLGVELEAGNQVLLFLNRRGYAPVLICHVCGWVSSCPHCDARMTLHKSDALLRCHHCGHQQPPPEQCPKCKTDDPPRTIGQGTERLEEVLRGHYPGHSIARIDRDSTRRKGSLEQRLDEIRAGTHRILLGTQMLAKGHHFPEVTLVGILDVDQGLYGADYRSAERMAQLIVQVAGRAGRARRPGRVVLQTRHPDHPLLLTLARQGYAAFAETALRERAEAHLPPFSHQALLRAEALDPTAAASFLGHAAQQAAALADDSVEIWGPVPAPMERRAGKTRAQLLVQSASRERLQRLLARWLPQLSQGRNESKVRWSLDVDPQEML